MKKSTARSFITVGLGSILIISWIPMVFQSDPTLEKKLSPLVLPAFCVYILGLCLVARVKGRCWAWGLSGLLFGIGGIAVAFLKDRSAPVPPPVPTE